MMFVIYNSKVISLLTCVHDQSVCCRMTVILKEESMTLYKDKNVFTAVVIVPGSSAAFGQVFVPD